MTSAAQDDRRTRRPDLTQIVAVAVWIALGGAVLVLTEPLAMYNRRGGPGPGFFLKWLAAFLLALALLRAITLLREALNQRRARRPTFSPGTGRAAHTSLDGCHPRTSEARSEDPGAEASEHASLGSRVKPENDIGMCERRSAAPIRGVNILRCLLMGGVLVAYAWLMPLTGFLLATTGLCFATLVLLGRHPLRAAIEAAVAAFGVRLAFTQGLGVPLPQAQIDLLRGFGL